MSALPEPQLRLRPMTLSDLDAVAAIEAQAYAFPWSRGNFVDSLAAGYWCTLLEADGEALGYTIAQPGVDELHLLNVTVAPSQQGRGRGSRLLGALEAAASAHDLEGVWLEVRQSNLRAQSLYRRRGYREAGRRRRYYPAPGGREDAIRMTLALPGARRGTGDDLD